ncbi:ubiquitin-like protein pmt3/smt3 [Trifolium pratense]|uniref:Uncharacterized protein n=1 Tax=Trifolium pratense TaxID=57577 RepID=A0ACB0L8S2_TRIPR|nr:ubiquitin-like protein pmt3/smt3 [Trifolium pratense]CAJ2664809.1 unnamed protein product [Trifolium pratense]
MEPTNHITIIVKDTDGIKKRYFSISKNTKMKKLMNSYCAHYSHHFDSIAFLFNARRIWPDQTPYELDIEDGDEIDAALYEHWSACINIDVKGQDGYEASYSFRRNCPLKKLMDEYCNQYDLDVSRVGFLFDGRLVQAEQTPHELGIEDGDEMLVMLHLRRHV